MVASQNMSVSSSSRVELRLTCFQCNYPQGKLFKINNLSDIDATLIEPASCAMHGLEKIAPKPGSHALLIGAGPTGLMMAQFL
jgi:D-arabinitol dehydrogenase (NADP+)